AYRTGKLSVTQASALVYVANQDSEAAWIEFAQRHPTAHLVRVVRCRRVIEWSHPDLARELRGMPPADSDEVGATAAMEQIRSIERLQMSAVAKPQDWETDRPSWRPLEPANHTLTLTAPVWVLDILRVVMMRIMSAADGYMRPWEAFELLIDDFVATHSPLEKRVSRVLARDGHRCQVPCCTRAVVEVHHIRFKSAGGSSRSNNLVCLCPFHHAHGIHKGLITLRGAAPDRLRWAFRLAPGAEPYVRYRGQTRVWQQSRPTQAWSPTAPGHDNTVCDPMRAEDRARIEA
ncbi:MAG TPA: hypothetical protein VGB99_16445, partial [Acidobacteriota bacterium]